jgi:Rps23 Pro-64 3,4-dihydroxylase Tpa1-like proline 4-hydroxylase
MAPAPALSAVQSLCFLVASRIVATSLAFSPVAPIRIDDVPILRFNNDPAFQAFRSGKVPLVFIPDALPTAMISSLLFDASALAATGFGATAGVGASRSHESQIRRNVHQVWLQSPGSNNNNLLVGDLDARKRLSQFIENLRTSLVQESSTSDIGDCNGAVRILPPEFVELSYLLYKPGSYYKRHVDTIKKSATTTNASVHDDDDNDDTRYERAVSIILYLGSNNDASDELRPCWDPERDGGALRVHGREFASLTGSPVKVFAHDGEVFSDIAPLAGSMLLFDSKKVPHEVMETRRNRVCLVGWFGARCASIADLESRPNRLAEDRLIC